MKDGIEIRTFRLERSRKPVIAAGIVFALMFGLAVLVRMNLGDAAWAVIPWFVLAAAVMVIIAFSSQKASFEVSETGLRVRGGIWGQSLAWNDLDVSHARIVHLDSESGLKPKWKTVGTALPGYSAGWFRLHDKSKALVFLTDGTEAVYIPTRKDFSVLLNTEDNGALLQAIQQFAK